MFWKTDISKITAIIMRYIYRYSGPYSLTSMEFHTSNLKNLQSDDLNF